MMFVEKDTICAISTPAGVGGVAIVRVSGPDAISIADSVLSMSKPLAEKKANTVSFGRLVKRELAKNAPVVFLRLCLNTVVLYIS